MSRVPAQKQKNISLAFFIPALCLGSLLATSLTILILFLVNFRSVSRQAAEETVSNQITATKQEILNLFKSYEDLLQHAAAGISVYLDRSEPVSHQEMRAYLRNISDRYSDVNAIYFCNNTVWNQTDGYMVFYPDWTPLDDWDNTKRPWFVSAKEHRATVAYSEPYEDSITHESCITFSLTVVNPAGQDIGVVAADILLNSLKSIINNNSGDSELFLIDTQGHFITHPSTMNLFQNDFFTELSLAQYRNPVLTLPSFSIERRGKLISSLQIPDVQWVLVSLMPSSVIYSDTNWILKTLSIIICICMVIIMGVIVYCVLNFIIRPIKDITIATCQLAEMRFDLVIKETLSTELNETRTALFTIRDNLKKKITTIGNEQLGRQLNISRNLNITIMDSSEELDVIMGNIKEAQEKTRIQAAAVDQTATSLNEIVDGINSLNSAVETQSVHLSSSSNSIELMVKNIADINEKIKEETDVTEDLSQSSESSKKMLEQFSAELTNIASRSEALDKANKMITNIAAQTNILAMNATIEATHAGESGKGFAVVANEIRDLAELSNKESESISEEVRKMTEGILAMQQVAAGTIHIMEHIFKSINFMDTSLATIKTELETQTTDGIKILTYLETIRKTMERVRTGSSTIHKNSGAIRTYIDNLKMVSQAVNSSLSIVQQSSNKIFTSINVAKKIAMGRYLIPPEKNLEEG
ncbi:methyl-accepting chemotaxis protein [Spirochaetia bacterium]|nr:methyl-accepting chemotaxis protein [Spirochaetia bacterium]GHU34576.1 methyl-accepting chemotaxis protein [Spirochaetia bacterium]